MTRVYFIRHARPDFNNHDDPTRPLTKQGLLDRALVTAYLADKDITAVYSSPFKRAYDTVAAFAESKGLRIETVEDFRERKISDEWIHDFDTYRARQWADFSYKLPTGECLDEVRCRNVAALRAVLRRHPDENIAVGTHGTALAMIINHYDPTFDHDAFVNMAWKMPWAAKLVFDGETCVEAERVDLQ